MDTAVNERAVLGGNNPPEPTPFEESQAEAIDLFDEAKNWCDGEPITSQQQADALSALLDQIKAAAKRADERRKEEARPHDDAKAEIQERYNTLIGNTKTTGKGILVLATEAVQAVRQPWLQKVEAEKQAAAEAARKAEEEKRRAAQEAFAKARETDDLAARQEAERLAVEAKKAEREASKADKAATTKTGLRTVVTADVVDMTEFAKWAWVNDRPALEDHFTARANALAIAGKRDMPGVNVTEERVAR